MTSGGRPFRIAAASSLRGAVRSLASGGAGALAGGAAALASVLVFSAGSGWATWSGIRAARAALPQLPALVPEILVERFLAAGLLSAAFLLVLGALTTAVSTLFLSPDTEALVPLPIPHARLFRRQLSRTVLSASAPSLLLVVPVLAVGAASSRRPLLAASTGLAVLAAVLLATGLAGCSLALLLVRLVPPRRARLFAAAVSALGLSAVLFGVRGARPERLFEPAAALALLERFGSVPPARSPFDPFAAGAHAVTQALFGDVRGVGAAVLLLAASAAIAVLVARGLAPLHLRLWQETREASGRGDPAAGDPAAPSDPPARRSFAPRRPASSGTPRRRRRPARSPPSSSSRSSISASCPPATPRRATFSPGWRPVSRSSSSRRSRSASGRRPSRRTGAPRFSSGRSPSRPVDTSSSGPPSVSFRRPPPPSSSSGRRASS